jgi:hypothetical protein
MSSANLCLTHYSSPTNPRTPSALRIRTHDLKNNLSHRPSRPADTYLRHPVSPLRQCSPTFDRRVACLHSTGSTGTPMTSPPNSVAYPLPSSITPSSSAAAQRDSGTRTSDCKSYASHAIAPRIMVLVGSISVERENMDSTTASMKTSTAPQANEEVYVCNVCHKAFEKRTYITQHTRIARV